MTFQHSRGGLTATPGQDEQALRCHRAHVDRMNAAGFLPYRMGLHAMDRLPARNDQTGDFLQMLKQTVDPNGILAPGRYSQTTLER